MNKRVGGAMGGVHMHVQYCAFRYPKRAARHIATTTSRHPLSLFPHSYTPEQINIQIAGPNTVVLSFVTFEPTVPTAQPVAMFGANNASLVRSNNVLFFHPNLQKRKGEKK